MKTINVQFVNMWASCCRRVTSTWRSKQTKSYEGERGGERKGKGQRDGRYGDGEKKMTEGKEREKGKRDEGKEEGGGKRERATEGKGKGVGIGDHQISEGCALG